MLPLSPAYVSVATPPPLNVNNSTTSGTLGLTSTDLRLPLSSSSGAIGNTVTRHAIDDAAKEEKDDNGPSSMSPLVPKIALLSLEGVALTSLILSTTLLQSVHW